jgi:hypothetical protein
MSQLALSTSRAAAFPAVVLLAACNALGGPTTANAPTSASDKLSKSIARAETGSLYVLSGDGTIAVFGGASLTFDRAITRGLDFPTSMAVNAKKQLLVSNELSELVTIYRSNASKPMRALGDNLKIPLQVVVTPKNDAYVMGKRVITVFLNSQNNKTKTIREFPRKLATDLSNNVYALGYQKSIYGIYVYPPEATKPSFVITQGLDEPQNIITDSSGNLYVANSGPTSCGNVSVYSTSTGALEYIISDGVCEPDGMVVDSNGNLYVGNTGAATVAKYAAGTNTLIETISQGISLPTYMTIDPSGTLYVANAKSSSSGNVTIYPSGQTKPSETLTKDIGSPRGIAWIQ